MSRLRSMSVVLSLFTLAFAGCGGEPASTDPADPTPAATAPTRTVPPPDRAGAWPQWRGADRDGVSDETGLLDAWPDGGPPLVWQSENAGMSYSSVAITEDAVYTLGARSDKEYAIRLDLQTGKREWIHEMAEDFDNNRGGGSRSTPTVVGDAVYVLGATGHLWALTTDGEAIWHVDLEEEFDTETLKWGISESPLVDGDLVIVATGSPEGSIVAFNRHDGDVVWLS